MKRILFSVLLLSATCLGAQELLPYQNPELTPSERAHDLVGRLTLDEKVGLMMDEARPVERLDVKPYGWWNEALHGVARAGFATVFPQAIGMGASFDTDLVNRVFTAVSDEARAKYNDYTSRGDHRKYHGLTFWTPTINIFRDPRWGRGQESYGEDPYLTGRMAVAVVNGLQGPQGSRYDKLHACAKHFAVHSGPEGDRHSFDAKNISARDLWETYLPAFEAAVREADVKQVMCAYQRYEGKPCCGSDQLLMKILRRRWGYRHIVVSDCWAINDFFMPGHHETHADAASASASAVLAGTDLECGYIYDHLREAVDEGYIQEAQLDISVERLLKERFSLGEMDDQSLVEWSHIKLDTVNCTTHQQLALEAARRSMVLLHNRRHALPLKKNDRRIIVMGSNATDSVMQWASYSGTPARTVTVLEGIRNTLGWEVPYERACDLVSNHVFESCFDRIVAPNGSRHGMTARYWNGTERRTVADATEFFTTPVKQDASGATAFAAGIDLRQFVAEYEGTYTPAEDEEMVFELGGRGAHFFLDGEKLLSPRKSDRLFVRRQLQKGHCYRLRVEFWPEEKVKVPYVDFDMGRHVHIPTSIAVEKAKNAETVIFVGGLTRFLEGEEMQVSYDGFKGGDRTSIELPPAQREILMALKAAGKRVIFVNCTGSAVALVPELQSCDAILQAWYPGEAGGQAVADVLFGDYNPGGKLPVTFYRETEDLPPFEDYSMQDRTYKFFEGQALWPFGYGLSYTTFTLGKATVKDAEGRTQNFGVCGSRDAGLTLSVPVRNTGRRDGDEVVQVYLRDLQDPDAALKQLCGFARVTVPAGKTVVAEVPIMNQGLRTFDAQLQDMVVKPGRYELLYGTSSADADLQRMQVVFQHESKARSAERQRIIVTSDAEIDDECSLDHLLLYLNDFDCEAIISSSSQYHAHDHKWAGDDWYVPYLKAYGEVYPNLRQHDARYPSPEAVKRMFCMGNVETVNEMETVTEGSQRIVEVLLDTSDPRPVWLQAWGGTNTIARALKTIEEEHPKEMARVAAKIRLYLIWEQDETYQSYIRPHWGRFNIPTIISDQFIAYFYHWKKYLLPEQQAVLEGRWMRRNILQGHGPLCALYKAHDNGDYRSEGDSPAFFHVMETGLRSYECPGWGGWGGRFVKVRENTWLDEVHEPGYTYPEGRWYTANGWGRSRLKMEIPNDTMLLEYLKPMWRWMVPLQNDFAARADWCVKPYDQANHQPVVRCNLRDVTAKAGARLKLSAKGTFDPDGNALTYRWWVYEEASNYRGPVEIVGSDAQEATMTVPAEARTGQEIHVILEVTDNGTPSLTRYARVVVKVK